MKNKGAIITFTIIITLLCLYYLQFTLVSRSIQQDAIEYATNEDGTLDFDQKQSYLDSIWNLEVYNFFGKTYTYKEIKETELSLGLDLQGGMHVTLEVSPEDIIRGLSGNNPDPDLEQALVEARKRLQTSQESFVDLFYQSFQELAPEKNLANLFITASNRGRFSSDMEDSEVLEVIREEVELAYDRALQIIRARVDQFGTSQPNIQQLPGTGRIQIELPGVENQERVRKLLQGVAKLEFFEVVEFNEIASELQAINAQLVEEESAQQVLGAKSEDTVDAEQSDQISEEDALSGLMEDEADTATQEQDTAADISELEQALSDTTGADTLQQDQSISQFLALLNGGYVNLKDTGKVNKILQRIMEGDLKGYLPANIEFLWAKETIEGQGGEPLLPLYAIRTERNGRAPLTGEVVSSAVQTYDETGRPAVSLGMNAEGNRKWARLTEQNIGSRLAIVLDDIVYSAPSVRQKIEGGFTEISGGFESVQEAQDLANVLKAGALPARTRIVEEAVIGPSLGKEAQRQGITSIIAGLAIVILFMILYYSKGGLIANVALIFNVFFILGILAQPGLAASLTLPGIAGIVLTIGMSIDANVLIFERIREELRFDRPLLKAISNGYDKAFSSIIDANVTTFLTAVILFTFGLGPVRGFATTLMIGIACSFFSAVYITRVIVSWSTKKGDKSKINFSTPFSKNLLANINIDFLSKRKNFYIASSSFIVIGMIILIMEGGLNLGVDFTGGRSYIVAFPEPVVASELKTSLADDFEEAGVEVKTYGANNVLKVTTSYLVGDESSEADQQVRQALVSGINGHTGFSLVDDEALMGSSNFMIQGSSKVGATIADDIKNSSLYAIIFSLIVIFIYILIRFKKWQYSSGAIVALVHDSLFVISAFAFARLFGKAFEIDQVFIAAMLTIIGYSINDTVVVFDRIRENLLERPHERNIDTFNMSINNTISRTLITSLTTLIVITILLIFGGEVLRGFSFALLVGVMVGTYSSVFIATPTVLDLSKSLKPKGES